MANPLIQKFANYLGSDPIYPFRGPLSPLMCGVTWTRKDSKPFYIIAINKGRDSFYAINEEAYFDYAREMFARYVKKEVTIPELQKAYDLVLTKINSLYEQVMSQKLNEANEEELTTWIRNSGELLTELIASSLYIETFDKHIALPIIGEQSGKMLEQIWDKATHPAFMSFEGRRLGDTLALLSSTGYKSPSESTAKKLKYIYTDYFSSKKDEEIIKHLEEIISQKEEKEAELAKCEADLKKATTNHDEWIKDLSPEELYLVSYIQFVMELRDLRKDPIAKTQAIMQEVAMEMLRRAQIPESMAYALFPAEYTKGIAALAAQKEEILKRKEGFVGLVEQTGACTTQLGDFDLLLKEFNDVVLKKSSSELTLKGQIANKGKITGTVKIVLDPHDNKEFTQGNILVTSMTRPEFVPLMKKAGAVVTNEGGITCHAAIVSRELGIPCIIGTKIATQMLKDGMTVEVDADKGIVKILS